MRCGLAAVVAAMAVAASWSAGAAEQGSAPSERALRALIEEALGGMPAEARLNGAAVSAELALDVLLANLPGPRTHGLYAPPSDVAVGARAGPVACRFAAVVWAMAVSQGAPAEALVDEAVVGAPNDALDPGSDVRCGAYGGGEPRMAYVTGTASAALGDDVYWYWACVDDVLGSYCPAAAWEGIRFRGVHLAGHVGRLDLAFEGWLGTVHIEMLFGGVEGWAPGLAGSRDLAVLAVQR